MKMKTLDRVSVFYGSLSDNEHMLKSQSVTVYLVLFLYYCLIIILLDTLYQCQCPRPSTKMILYYETIINQRIKKEKLMIQ